MYYRHIYPSSSGLPRRSGACPGTGGATRPWPLAGIEALAGFIRDLGLPTTLRQLGVEREQLKEIADSCGISPGSYRRMTHQEILELFQECYESPL